MPSFFEMLTPRYHEEQRRLARNKFAAGIAQPEIFKTENFPLGELAGAYEKGYGMPYPTQQPTAPMPVSPTAPEHTQNLATNMPIELVAPRSLEESTMRTAGIQGRAGAEKDISSLQHYGEQMPRLEGFFEDAGEDVGEYDIPASLGGMQRKEPTVPEGPSELYGDKYWDEKSQSWLQRETTTGEERRIAGAPGGGSGDGTNPEIDRAILIRKEAVSVLDKFVDRVDPQVLWMMKEMGFTAMSDPKVNEHLKGVLNPQEQEVVRNSMLQIDWANKQINQSIGAGGNDPMGIRQ